MAKAKPTWFAVIVCVIAVIPGIIVGAVVSFVYRMFVVQGPAPDPFGLHFLFGIDTISKILSWVFYWIFYVEMAAVLRGGIAGAVSVGLTIVICRGANIAKAAFITGALYTGLIALVFFGGLFTIGITRDAVVSVFELVGLWVGLILVATISTEVSAEPPTQYD
jgi:hypothetical protein